jgi:hypothetical protein
VKALSSARMLDVLARNLKANIAVVLKDDSSTGARLLDATTRRARIAMFKSRICSLENKSFD